MMTKNFNETPIGIYQPNEVLEVIEAWQENAREAGMPKDSCYVTFKPDEERRIKELYAWVDHGTAVLDCRYKEISGPAWQISCNYECGPILFWFTEQNVWLYCEQYADGCKIMKHGLDEAIGTAKIVYTG